MAQNTVPWNHELVAELLRSGALRPSEIPKSALSSLHEKAVAELHKQKEAAYDPVLNDSPKAKRAKKSRCESTKKKRAKKEKAAPSQGTLLTVDVPIPPSTNNLFPTIHGRRITSPEYKAWKKDAYPLLSQLKACESYPVEVWAVLRGSGINANRDVANIEKAIGDGLVSCGVIVDDKLKYVSGCLQLFRPDGGEQRVSIFLASPIRLPGENGGTTTAYRPYCSSAEDSE